MAMHCSGVLPGAYTASGMPTRAVGDGRPWRSQDRETADRVAPQRRAARRCRRQLRPAAPAARVRPRTPSCRTAAGPTMRAWPSTRVAFLGPLGTFTEQALLTQADLAGGELVPLPSIPEVLGAVRDGAVDLGFVAIENSIEGTVNLTQDGLIFTHDLLIQRGGRARRRALPARPAGDRARRRQGRALDPGRHRAVHPFLHQRLSGVELHAANSTAEAARTVSEADEGWLGSDRAAWLASCMGSRCWPTTSPITTATRRASSSLPATRPAANRARQDVRGRLPACQRAGQPDLHPAGVRRPARRPEQAGEPPDEGRRSRRLLLRDRCRRAHRRRAGRRRPAQSPRQAGWGEVPRLVPAATRTPARRGARRRPLASGRRLDAGAARASRSTALPRHAGALRRLGR